MRFACTPWHTLVFVALAGCSGSHVLEDAGRDAGEDARSGCPDSGILLGSCMDTCCANFGRPSFDAECNPICPTGSSLIDRCAPSACCGDSDAGPPPTCHGGACCTLGATPVLSSDCVFTCPSGFSLNCVPDPGADCISPWLACDVPSDCQLAPADSCCFPCDSLELAEVTGINMSGAAEYYAQFCPLGAACPPCAPLGNPALRATCGASTCTVVDVRALPLSACNADTDCVLRATDCCVCGASTSPETLIAVRAEAELEYQAIACDPGQGCDDCLPAYPTTVEAFCATDGHCGVRPVP